MTAGDRFRNHDARVAYFDANRDQGSASIETRIGRRIKVTPGGCWAFDGVLDEYGYVDRKLVHRVVYEAMVGEVPNGWHVRHTCGNKGGNKGCANPKHLELLKPSDPKAEHKQAQLNRHLAAKLRGIAS